MPRLFRSVIYLSIATAMFGCAELLKQIKKPTFELSDVTLEAMSLQFADLNFNFKVSNPNPLGLAMQGLQYQLDVQDKQLLSGNTKKSLRVEANASSELQLPLRVEFLKVLNQITDLQSTRVLHYRLSGHADFGIFAIPFEKTGNIQLPSLPSIHISNVRLKSIDLKQLRMSADLEIRNDNAFPLNFSGLQYRLNAGGDTWLSADTGENILINSNNRTLVPLDIRLNVLQAAGWVDKVRKGKDIPLDLSGSLHMPGQQNIPINWKGITKILK